MTEMIDRLAKAMCKSEMGFGDWDRIPQSQHDLFRKFAKIAIGEMREPMEAMVRAACEHRGQQSYSDVWHVMVDAALEEK